MNQTYSKIPETISPLRFPAKLWHMVNDPANSAICWDKTGEVILVDQHRFEKFVLSPISKDDEECFDYFSTTQFSSFVRQLNNYGFRKTETTRCIIFTDNELIMSSERWNKIHHFINPNFRRDNPALLVNLKRLTVKNKARMNSGTDVKCQAQGKQEEGDSEKCLMKGNSSSDKRACKVMSPPCHLIQGNILRHPPSAALSTPQQACTCFQPPLMPNGTNRPLMLFYIYLPATSPVYLGPNSHGPSSQNKEQNQKPHVNLDRVFQIADEVMPIQPNNNLTKIVNPEIHSWRSEHLELL